MLELNRSEKLIVPPDPAVPDTTRSAALSWSVSLVHPVGAVDWTNSIAVPDGISGGGSAGGVK